MIPLEVLERAASEMTDYANTGMSVMEMSHRTKAYEEVNSEAQRLLRELMGIPDNYSVIFVQGGASAQFGAVPLNLATHGRADYVVTGNFASLAYKEGKRLTDAAVAASSEDKTYTYIPELKKEMFRSDIDYIHITANNTIFGTRYTSFPETDAPLVADISSNILSQTMDVSKFGVAYAGAQKNIGPAGLVVVIVRKDLLDKASDKCPTMLMWATQDKNDSMYNTPPTFSVYIAKLVFEWLKKLGGVKEIQKINEYKAGLLYDFIDNSSFYTNSVVKKDRSIMNVPFVSPNPDLDSAFVKAAAQSGLVTLKGHRLVGGMRASIYNAMPVEGVKALIEFMKKFEMENK